MKKLFKTPLEHYLYVKGKKYQYTLDPEDKDWTFFICPSAGIKQRFLHQDIPALLVDLPVLIIDEQEYQKKEKQETLRFRVSSSDKKKIEQKAYKAGFKSVSAFLRSLALAS